MAQRVYGSKYRPTSKISNKCCEYAKKKPAKLLIKQLDADLEIIGVRKAEGGIRSASYKTCFSESKTKGCNSYRPVFWYTDSDKKAYEEFYNIQHSRCYTEYGLKRTGCVGCPYNPKVTEELEIIKKFEPNLYTAAVNIFGDSYEYTRKYREFQKMMKQKAKEQKMLKFILGLILGGNIGVFTMALLQVNRGDQMPIRTMLVDKIIAFGCGIFTLIGSGHYDVSKSELTVHKTPETVVTQASRKLQIGANQLDGNHDFQFPVSSLNGTAKPIHSTRVTAVQSENNDYIDNMYFESNQTHSAM